MPKIPIDGLIVIFLGYFAFKGMKKGLVGEVFKLVGIFAGILLAAKYFDAGTPFVVQKTGMTKNIAAAVSFAGIFIGVALIMRIIAGSLKALLDFSMLGWLDQGGGAVFGALKASMIVSSVLLAVSFIPGDIAKNLEKSSKLYTPIKSITPKVYDFVGKAFPESQKFYDKLQKLIGDAAKAKTGGKMPSLDQLQGSKDANKQMEELLKKYGK